MLQPRNPTLAKLMVLSVCQPLRNMSMMAVLSAGNADGHRLGYLPDSVHFAALQLLTALCRIMGGSKRALLCVSRLMSFSIGLIKAWSSPRLCGDSPRRTCQCLPRRKGCICGCMPLLSAFLRCGSSQPVPCSMLSCQPGATRHSTGGQGTVSCWDCCWRPRARGMAVLVNITF